MRPEIDWRRPVDSIFLKLIVETVRDKSPNFICAAASLEAARFLQNSESFFGNRENRGQKSKLPVNKSGRIACVSALSARQESV
jgi:hypothetical protein